MKDWEIILLAVAGGVAVSELLRRYLLGHSYKPQVIQRVSAPWGSESPKRIVRRGRVI